MATVCNIAIGINCMDAKVICCTNSGMPMHVGRMLKLYWNTRERVEELISMGDAFHIGKFIGEKHELWDEPGDMCTFFHRDNGETEEGTKATTLAIHHSWASCAAEYDYLFMMGIWWVRPSDDVNGWRPLNDKECTIFNLAQYARADREIMEHEARMKAKGKNLDEMLDEFLEKMAKI